MLIRQAHAVDCNATTVLYAGAYYGCEWGCVQECVIRANIIRRMYGMCKTMCVLVCVCVFYSMQGGLNFFITIVTMDRHSDRNKRIRLMS